MTGSDKLPILSNFGLSRKSAHVLSLSVCLLLYASATAHAETIRDALIYAYQNNPTLNAERASVRAVDEQVAIAKSGYRPTITVDSEIGYSSSQSNSADGASNTELAPGEIGVSVNQTLWDSNRTGSEVSSARSAVSSAHESLRGTEQDVLLSAATAFLDVLRERAILRLQRKNLVFLNEQVKSEKSRRAVGESTRTDVAQALAGQAEAQANVSLAIGNLKTSEAVYRQVIGKRPKQLSYTPLNLKYPNSLSRGIQVAETEHPTILTAEHNIDEAAFDIKNAESELLPRVDLVGKAARVFDRDNNTSISDEYSVFATLEVPIYQAGRQSAIVRQNKEVLGQRQIELDETIDAVRADVVSAYAERESALASLRANEEQIKASSLALKGTVEQRAVGESTTLDVLNTQSTLIDAQIETESSKRDARLAGFTILSAVGRLSISRIGSTASIYDPADHLETVQDKWFGLRVVNGQ